MKVDKINVCVKNTDVYLLNGRPCFQQHF